MATVERTLSAAADSPIRLTIEQRDLAAAQPVLEHLVQQRRYRFERLTFEFDVSTVTREGAAALSRLGARALVCGAAPGGGDADARASFAELSREHVEVAARVPASAVRDEAALAALVTWARDRRVTGVVVEAPRAGDALALPDTWSNLPEFAVDGCADLEEIAGFVGPSTPRACAAQDAVSAWNVERLVTLEGATKTPRTPVAEAARTPGFEASALAERLDVSRGGLFLDVAGHQGRHARRLLRHLPDHATVVVVDCDPLAIARGRRIATACADRRLQFRAASAYQLPFDDGAANGLLLYGATSEFEPARVFREFRRVLAADGRLVIGEPVALAQFQDPLIVTPTLGSSDAFTAIRGAAEHAAFEVVDVALWTRPPCSTRRAC
ncbi:MAG TPA: class I SAM-dependent methyltransferase [Minicystis sp.]|nr:class I SAM-dependent methyltransferase [Minicystis sp.]